jgi:hypothetical protein
VHIRAPVMRALRNDGSPNQIGCVSRQSARRGSILRPLTRPGSFAMLRAMRSAMSRARYEVAIRRVVSGEHDCVRRAGAAHPACIRIFCMCSEFSPVTPAYSAQLCRHIIGAFIELPTAFYAITPTPTPFRKPGDICCERDIDRRCRDNDCLPGFS